MYKYHCLNPISPVGLEKFSSEYQETDNIQEADVVLVRSADMKSMDLPENLKAIARAGAGVNNIPLGKCSDEGIVVFNTPGANANGVKELVIAGMLLASRDIVGGIEWVESEQNVEDIGKLRRKEKTVCRPGDQRQEAGNHRLGAIGVLVANAATHLGMEVYGYDPYISVEAAWNLSRTIKHINDLSIIYKECDYITIHVPLTDETRGMINAEPSAR